MTGRDLCYHHGGKSLTGIANPAYTNGNHSRYLLPPRLRPAYETALSDPRLLELKDDIAVTQARIQDLYNRVHPGESGTLWKLLQKAYFELREGITSGDKDKQSLAFAELGSLIQRGIADHAAWEEIGKQTDRRQRLVESERKRAIELHQMVTLDSIKPYLFDTIDFIRRYITDRGQLAEYQRIIETRLGTGEGGSLTATVDESNESVAEPESSRS